MEDQELVQQTADHLQTVLEKWSIKKIKRTIFEQEQLDLNSEDRQKYILMLEAIILHKKGKIDLYKD
jgi:hypothetical protein